jgi:hypothetical protein
LLSPRPPAIAALLHRQARLMASFLFSPLYKVASSLVVWLPLLYELVVITELNDIGVALKMFDEMAN